MEERHPFDYHQYSIGGLKQLGHDLLDIYISLDAHRPRKKARMYAYDKLADKLQREPGKHHFKVMQTHEELVEAIAAIRKMIVRRKQKIAYEAKNVYAPDLIALQRNRTQ